ncbi:MAG: glycosyltransferase family 39 protein [Nitrososphaeraceae archaeon]|nr:glycosyltransferase family 39 protein [Nitrososphaeraceae archaeon]
MGSISYPHSLLPPNTGSNMQNFIEMLYFVPRIMMGILAVIDTFLIYKISEYYYSRKIAFISSTLFAVMPSTWFIRWILLDSIQITLILSSILFAVYTRHSKDKNKKSRPKLPLILLSGIFLGLAIFTKIPAFTMIPLVGFLVYIKNHNMDSKKLLGLWLIPVILIPSVWPAYSMSIGRFNFWVAGILWQVHRESQPFLASIDSFFKNDPILLTLGIAGLAFAIIKKDFLLLLWSIPFIIFLFLIGYVSSYHLIPLLPVLCIAGAALIEDIVNKLSKRNVLRTLLISAIASSIGIFGLINTALLITTNTNSSYFKSAAFVVQYLQNINHESFHSNFNKITVIADPFFLWIPQYIFQLDFNYRMYYDNTPIKTQRALLIIDHGLMNSMSRNDDAAKQLKEIYHSPKTNILRIFGENGNIDNQISIYQYVK